MTTIEKRGRVVNIENVSIFSRVPSEKKNFKGLPDRLTLIVSFYLVIYIRI